MVVLGARVLLVAYVLLPVLLTLGPTPEQALTDVTDLLTRIVEGLSGGRADIDVVQAESLANIALFVPLGLLLALALPRVYLSALLVASAAGSVFIEFVQYALLPDRVPAILDIAANTAGAAMGLVLGGDLRRLLLRPTPSRERQAAASRG